MANQAPGHTALLLSPDYLAFDLRTGPAVLFAQVSEATYRQSAFLDHRIEPRPQEFHTMSLAQVGEAGAELPAPPAMYIAHTSFCCSTLLARCLQAEQLLCLREPRILGVLANEYRRGLDAVQVDPSTHLIFRLLGKRYHAGQKVLIKGTNFTNNLVPALLRLWPDMPLLLMWGTLEDFLVSMCKHQDEAGKNLWPFLRAFLIDAKIPHHRHHEWEALELLQQAVWVWILQIRSFAAWLAQYPQIHTLAAKDFLANPLAVTAALHKQLKLEVGTAEREQQVLQTMARDAKKVAGPSQDEHARQRSDIRVSYDEKIAATLSWAEQQNILPDLSLIHQRSLTFS